MYIRFIAHAGFALEEDGHQVLIDPWFTDSTVKTPIMQAVVGHNTIDFQVPKTTESIGAYHPDTILLSHFHAHHAVHDDLVTLATQSKRIALCFPDVGQDNTRVEQTFALWPHVETIPFQHNDVKTDGPFSVRGLLHTVPKHIAWYVESKTGSILHIADPHINRDSMSRQIGEEWKQFEGLQPDLLCINAGGNGLRREKDGRRYIVESGAVSPIEAARLAELIRPKALCLIGCYNWSVWRNRSEYIRPAPLVEEELYWALSWLVPEVKFFTLKPGNTIGIGDMSLAGSTDYFITGQS